MLPKTVDDRIWLADFNEIVDWEAIWRASQHKSTAGKCLATWWIQATAGVNYYRAELPARYLPGKTVRFEERDIRPDGNGGHVFPRQEGKTAIWMFPGNVTRWLAMAELGAVQNHRVLVEVDDNYTTPPPTGPGLDSGWLRGRDKTGGDGHSYQVHRAIVSSEACDGIIVSTPKLSEVYEQFGKPVYVCPNSIDPFDWGSSPPHQEDGILHVGWAGSASHRYDLSDIRAALDWASRQKDVEVVILGQLDPGVPHRNIPWTNSLAEYRSNVRQVDVMLCPIRPGAWADCKSDVKAMEAAMGGACSIVSKTEPFRPWFDGPAYVAERPKDYVKLVKHLILNREEARETARLARKYVLRERTIQGSIARWREAIDG